MFVTYVVLDPRKPGNFQSPLASFLFKPVYIGKGKPDRPLDILSFLEGRCDSYSGKRINNWLKGMRNKGFREVPIVTIHEGDEEQAFAKESILTHHFGIIPEGGILYNQRHGGAGGWSLSDDTKTLLSKINSGEGNPNFGKKWSEERHAKQIRAWKSKDRSRSSEQMMKTWIAMRRKYLVTSPIGEVFETDHLTKWCNERGHALSALRASLKHNTPISPKSSMYGWSISYLK